MFVEIKNYRPKPAVRPVVLRETLNAKMYGSKNKSNILKNPIHVT